MIIFYHNQPQLTCKLLFSDLKLRNEFIFTIIFYFKFYRNIITISLICQFPYFHVFSISIQIHLKHCSISLISSKAFLFLMYIKIIAKVFYNLHLNKPFASLFINYYKFSLFKKEFDTIQFL